MHTIDDAGRTASLVIELPSGTAILHGEEVELPLREFRLLAELARRVGEAVPAEELIQAIWPDEPWTPKENLHHTVTKLRRHIDGSTKFGAAIRNRRGFGYILDLDSDEVVVLESVAPKPIEDIVIRLEPEEPAEEEQESSVHAPESRRIRLLPVVMGTFIALLAIALAWSAGFALSSWFASRSESASRPESTVANPGAPAAPGAKDDDGDRRGTKREGRRGKRGGKRGPAGGSASSVSSDSPSSVVSQPSQGSTQDSHKESKKDQAPPEPALPPAPTRYLYHLFNTNTGDHFVTTDGNTASEYEAKGYRGGAIARVYTYQEQGTKAISTNAGTAYIFISSAPKTEPASKVVRLWYSTNDGGDFFYTTNESEAKQEGWQGTVIGYVRAL